MIGLDVMVGLAISARRQSFDRPLDTQYTLADEFHAPMELRNGREKQVHKSTAAHVALGEEE